MTIELTDTTATTNTRKTKADFTVDDVETYGVAAKLRDSQRQLMLGSLTMSYGQMAEQFGMPIGTVKSQINRARERLAKAKAERNEAVTQ